MSARNVCFHGDILRTVLIFFFWLKRCLIWSFIVEILGTVVQSIVS